MIRWLPLLILSFITLPIAANAESIDITKLTALTTASDTLSGRFSQEKYLASVEATVESNGHFDYVKDRQLRWITEHPLHDELVMTTDPINDDPGNGAQQRHPAAQLMSKVFLSVITADWQQLSRYFEIGASSEGDGWHVDLRPLHGEIKAMVSRVELSGDSFVRRIVLTEQSGDRTSIQFSGLTH